MKKLLLLFCCLSFFNTYTFAQSHVYPKKCITYPSVTEQPGGPVTSKAVSYSIHTSKATISKPLLPVGLMEGQINDGVLQTGAMLSIGAGWMYGVTDVTVYADSSVLSTGTIGVGGIIIYGESSLTKKQSLILAGVVSYSDFLLGPGIDLKAKSNMFRLVFTANLDAILPSLLTSLKL